MYRRIFAKLHVFLRILFSCLPHACMGLIVPVGELHSACLVYSACTRMRTTNRCDAMEISIKRVGEIAQRCVHEKKQNPNQTTSRFPDRGRKIAPERRYHEDIAPPTRYLCCCDSFKTTYKTNISHTPASLGTRFELFLVGKVSRFQPVPQGPSTKRKSTPQSTHEVCTYWYVNAPPPIPEEPFALPLNSPPNTLRKITLSALTLRCSACLHSPQTFRV